MKVEAYLWTRKNADNKYPIKIRITENRKSKFVSLNYSINKSYWNPKTHRVRETYSEHLRINEIIENKIKEIQHQKSVAAPTTIKNTLSYFEYFDNYLIWLEKSNKFGTLKKHRVILKHLRQFVKEEYNKDDLLFDDIDRFFLKKLRAYFYGVPLLEITQNGYFKKIKHLYYEAIKDNQYLPVLDPFTSFVNKSSKAKNKSLTLNEFISIEIFNPFQYDFLSKKVVSSEELFDAKNAFLFQLYMRGIRVSDFIFLKWENINNRKIEYVMRKTNKSISVPINDKLLYILRLYIPLEFKKQYLKREKYSDIEMFYSLPESERELIRKQLKRDDLYTKFKSYSYYHEIKSKDTLLNIYNHLSTEKSYRDDYIFNLLKPTQIEKIRNASKEEYKRIEYNLIQSATALYNKQLKLINNFIFDENGQHIKTTITSHLARHTYASIGVKLGFDVNTISKSLGHKDLKTTQLYLRTLDTDFVDEENEKLFNSLHSRVAEHLERSKNIVVARKEDVKVIKKT